MFEINLILLIRKYKQEYLFVFCVNILKTLTMEDRSSTLQIAFLNAFVLNVHFRHWSCSFNYGTQKCKRFLFRYHQLNQLQIANFLIRASRVFNRYPLSFTFFAITAFTTGLVMISRRYLCMAPCYWETTVL